MDRMCRGVRVCEVPGLLWPDPTCSDALEQGKCLSPEVTRKAGEAVAAVTCVQLLPRQRRACSGCALGDPGQIPILPPTGFLKLLIP